MIGSQACWEIDLVLDNKVASLTGLLRDGHTQTRVPFLTVGLSRTSLLEVDLLAVNSSHRPSPSTQGLLELQCYDVDKIVVLTLIKRVFFLRDR